MADLQTNNVENIHMNDCGYELSFFVDENIAIIYKCGICDKVCKDAVEIAELEHQKGKFDVPNTEEGALFCHRCIQRSNMPQNSYHSAHFLRNIINNLTVICPHSTHSILTDNDRDKIVCLEGNVHPIYCEWKGKLSELEHHIENECLNKPLIKCPFECSAASTQITRSHLNENQTEHIDILLTMVQSLSNQLSECQQQIKHLQHDINTNKKTHNTEINMLKQQLSMRMRKASRNIKKSKSIPYIRFPPPPPSKNLKNISSSFVKRPIGSVTSDFVFQIDHPNVVVIANGRTAICTQSTDTLIEFGSSILRKKPSHKYRTRHRDSSIDDFFADPSTLQMNDDELTLNTRFSNPHKQNQMNNIMIKKRPQHRRCKSEMSQRNNEFVMSRNRLVSLQCSDQVSCWECYVFIEDCDETGNIGIAMIRDSNDGICVLYSNGDYIDLHNNKTNKNEFRFHRGNMVRICVRWNRLECLVSVTNIDTNKSVVINGLDMFVKFGFILNSARITVIEQFYK